MAYATAQDALDRYGDDYVIVSCDRDGDGLLDEDQFDLALEDASDWIDSYLVGRFTSLPLAAPFPRRLVKICIDVAIYELCEGAPTMTTQKQARFDNACKFMENVKAGSQRLTVASADAVGVNGTQAAQTVIQKQQKAERLSGARQYTRDTLRKL